MELLGTISVMMLDHNYVDFKETPSIECYDYTKEIQKMNRIDFNELLNWFKNHINFAQEIYKDKLKVIVILERPMVNPQRFKQSRLCFKSI